MGVIIVCGLVFLPLLVTVIVRMESEQPRVKLELPSMFIGMDKELEIFLEDPKSGLKRFWVAILQDGKETILLEKHFPASGLLHKGSVKSESIRIKVGPKKNALKDGKAILRLMAIDYSWKSWGKGNRAYDEREIIIDTEAPIVRVLTRSHNIRPGGSNVVAYALSEPCEINGVQVADQFYPGHAYSGTKNEIQIAFFALNHLQDTGTEIVITAKDRAGNQTKTGFPHYIATKKFKKDSIRIKR